VAQFVEEFAGAQDHTQPLYIARASYSWNETMSIANAYENMLQILDYRSEFDGQHPQLKIMRFEGNASSSVQYQLNKVEHFRMDLDSNYKAALSAPDRDSLNEYHRRLNYDLNLQFDVAAIRTLTTNSSSNAKYMVKIGNVEKHLTSVNEFVSALMHEMSVAVRANLFYTMANSKGFRPHFGTEDVLILQLNGSAHWLVYPHMYQYCASEGDSFPWNVDLDEDVQSRDIIEQKSFKYCHRYVVNNLHESAADGYGYFDAEKLARSQLSPLVNVTLNAGDLLFMPRGFIHDANVFDLSQPSVHLAIGMYRELQCDFLFTVVRFMFSMDVFEMLWTKMFVIFKKDIALELGHHNAVAVGMEKNEIRKAVLRELEYFLFYESFIDDTLRRAMPFGFYRYDVFMEHVFDTILVPLVEVTLEQFLSYCSNFKQLNHGHPYKKKQKDELNLFYRNKNPHKNIEELMEILRRTKVQHKLFKKISNYYKKTITEFDGVYLPEDSTKEHGKQFKRISYALRKTESLVRLPKVLKKRPTPM